LALIKGLGKELCSVETIRGAVSSVGRAVGVGARYIVVVVVIVVVDGLEQLVEMEMSLALSGALLSLALTLLQLLLHGARALLEAL
jgi:hypothetical protein